MPIPHPKPNESEQEFVSRCVASELMQREFPDQKQRLAVCYSHYRNVKKIRKRRKGE